MLARLRLALMAEQGVIGDGRDHNRAMQMITAEYKRTPMKPVPVATYVFAELTGKAKRRELKRVRHIYDDVVRKQDYQGKEFWGFCKVGGLLMQEAMLEKDAKSKKAVRVRALEAFQLALKANTRCQTAANGIGVCLALLGMKDKARDVLNQVKEVAPNYQAAWLNLALVLHDLRMFHEASVLVRDFYMFLFIYIISSSKYPSASQVLCSMLNLILHGLDHFMNMVVKKNWNFSKKLKDWSKREQPCFLYSRISEYFIGFGN